MWGANPIIPKELADPFQNPGVGTVERFKAALVRKLKMVPSLMPD
jgi:hypothetical protein